MLVWALTGVVSVLVIVCMYLVGMVASLRDRVHHAEDVIVASIGPHRTAAQHDLRIYCAKWGQIIKENE